MRGQRQRRPQRRRRGRGGGRRGRLPSPPTTSSTAPRARRTWRPTSRRRSRATAAPSSPARWRPRPQTRATSSSARPGCSGRRPQLRRDDAGAAPTGARCSVVRDQTGSPTWTGHLADGIVRLIEGIEYGMHHMAAAGQCTWYDFAGRSSSRPGSTAGCSRHHREFAPPAPRPAFSVLGTQREHAIRLPDWQDGLGGYLARAEGSA